MTNISAQDRRVQYTGNGTAGPFSFSFQVNAITELKIYVDSTLKSITTHYTIEKTDGTSGQLNTDGSGRVRFTSGNFPTNSQTITIMSNIAIARTSQFTTGGSLTASALETEFNNQFMHHQQHDQRLDRALLVPEHDTISGADLSLPANASRLGKLLGFNSSTGNPEASFTVADGNTLAGISADIATLADIEDGTDATDAIQTVAGISTAVSNVSGISSAVSAVNSNSSNINTLAQSSVITDMSLLAVTAVIEDMALLANADVISDMNTLAVTDVINDINTLATSDIVSDINALATTDVISDLNTLATSDIISDLNTLAVSDVISDINTLATSDIVTDLNLLATSDFVSDLNTMATTTNVNNLSTVAGAILNINTVAGANSNISALNASGVISNIATTAGAISNINTVASANSNISILAGISSDITTLAGTTGLTTLANNASNISTVATNITNVNTFANRYRIASSAPTSSLDVGDLYFDSTSNILKVYGASGWQSAGSSVNGTSQRYTYNISGTPSSVTGSDANSNTLAYDAGFIDVYLNGVKLVNGTDCTVTSGDTVAFASALANGDVVDIVAYGTFNVAQVNADNLNSGTVPIARLGTSGTKNTTTFLRGDNTFATVDTTNASNLSTGTLPNARLSSVPNSALANSSITINGSAISLGGSVTVETDFTWETKTSAFNASSSKGYFVDTTSGAVTATLPASPTAGDTIRFIDLSATFDTNNLTVARNSKKIQGDTSDMTVATERAGFALVFSGDTQGWLLMEK